MDIRLHVARPASNIIYKFVTNFVPPVTLSASADFINLSGCRFVFAIGQLSTRRTRSSIRASLMHPGCGCDRSSVAVESRVANFQQADAIKTLINGGTVSALDIWQGFCSLLVIVRIASFSRGRFVDAATRNFIQTCI